MCRMSRLPLHPAVALCLPDTQETQFPLTR
uniref:Uncharacterized protein n=1 Tax=Arundo donax TaxID=35708 RepID=A0A0A9A653_ARUDO